MLKEAIGGLALFFLYYVVAASTLLLLKHFAKPEKEVFRKMLHMACVLSVFVLLYAFSKWYFAAGTALLFAILIYPLICLLERYPHVMALLIERREGEIKRSLMVVFFMMAALISVFWGIFGAAYKYVVLIAVLAWGLGDASAALVGKNYGAHKIKLPYTDGKKTVEGSLAMYLVASLITLLLLLIFTELSWWVAILVAILVGVVASLIELVSSAGSDTITVPFGVAACMLFILFAFSYFGVLL